MKKISRILLGTVFGLTAISALSYADPLTPAQEGRKLYLKLNCYGCHGVRGLGGMGPSLKGEADEVGEAVLEGEEEGMPSFRNYVSNTDIGNLQAYLQTLGKANEPTFLHWWEDVPSQ